MQNAKVKKKKEQAKGFFNFFTFAF